MGNLMTPGQMGFIFRFHAFGGVPICISPQSRSIFVKFLGGSVRFVAVLGGEFPVDGFVIWVAKWNG